jgi:hypothetical protein
MSGNHRRLERQGRHDRAALSGQSIFTSVDYIRIFRLNQTQPSRCEHTRRFFSRKQSVATIAPQWPWKARDAPNNRAF